MNNARWLRRFLPILVFVASLAAPIDVASAAPSPESEAKTESLIATVAKWASDPVIVAAVRTRNSAAPPALAGMNQVRWSGLSVLDPILRELSRNDAARALKSLKDESVTEMFLNAADGTKVALLARTTSWSHKGSDKHDVPMNGQAWKSAVGADESSGLEQMQIAVPVLDGGTPIGSLVVGFGLGVPR